jgi:hypothetical protein
VRIVFLGLLTLPALAVPAAAQSRQPTAQEIAAVRDCATKNRDNIDVGGQRCLFNLVATPCINGNSADAADNAAIAAALPFLEGAVAKYFEPNRGCF